MLMWQCKPHLRCCRALEHSIFHLQLPYGRHNSDSPLCTNSDSDTTTHTSLEKVITTPHFISEILIPNPCCLNILCYCTDSSTSFHKYRDSNTFLEAKSVSNTPPKLSIPHSNRYISIMPSVGGRVVQIKNGMSHSKLTACFKFYSSFE